MAVVPRSLLTFGAGLLSARAAARLRRQSNAHAAQAAVFERLIPGLARASVWHGLGTEAKMTHDSFRARIPLQSHKDVAPHVEAMKMGAENVLWPGKCQIYALTSGTTDGTGNHLPVTEAMLGHFRRANVDSILWYTARVGRARVFRGRHLHLAGSTTLSPIPQSAPFEAYSGDLGGISALNFPKWMDKHFHEPGAKIAQMVDWPAKLAAIAERTSKADISLIAGMPNWVLILAESIRERAAQAGHARSVLQEIWPNLECLVHGGVPIAPFEDELREVLGPTVNFHEVFHASEGFIAAQDSQASAGLRLMTDAGIFFEFLPMADFDESRLSALGEKAVPLSGVAVGVDYALVLTTPAGLARYVTGDVVRFVSTAPARLIYVGRTKLRLNAFGENVIEKEITDALLAVCRRHGWTIVNYHVAPIFTTSVGRAQGRHEWWIELKPRTPTTPTGPVMAVELDAELGRLNGEYRAKRSEGTMEAPYVRLVMPGVFAQWMRHHGKWGGQNKMPRCRSDRVIADELGRALQFAKD
jgi:hypothetical protein